MKIKINIKTGIIVLSSFLAFACEDILDIQPQDQISEGNIWKTEKDLTSAVNGVYEVMLESRNTFQMFGYLDVFTPLGMSRNGSHATLGNGNYTDDHGIISARWRDCFRGIVRANDVLDHVDEMDKIDEEIRDERKGEALFLRAWYYFNLVYHFGDLPLLEKVPTLDDETMQRSPKSDIIAFILSDLNEIIDNAYLPVTRNSEKGRATIGAALFLKTKINLMEHNYDQAIEAAEDLMDLGVYSLYPDFKAIWSKNNEHNDEVIFNLESFSGSGDRKHGNDWDKLFSSRKWGPTNIGGWSRGVPTTFLLDFYEKTDGTMFDSDTITVNDYLEESYYNDRDPRLDMSVMRPGATFVGWNGKEKLYPDGLGGSWSHSKTGLHIRKFVSEGSNEYTNWDSPQNWIYFRYADLLLMYAEAKLENIDGGEGMIVNDQELYDAINEVRQRPSVDMPAIETGKTILELREIIRNERPREMAMEGWYFFDLIRWGETRKELIDGFEVWSLRTKKVIETRRFEDKHKLWPIPLNERLLSPNLGQNPGWSS